MSTVGPSTETSTDLVAELYEPEVTPARERFDALDPLAVLTNPGADPVVLDGFLIRFCALGVQMTRPVEDWIRRAGERCKETGFAKLGAALVRHAAQEADHHEMMIADTRTLVDMWNSSGRSPLDADELFSLRPTPGVAAYVTLHEETIAGPRPFAQLGIEYEIERLSVTAAGKVLGNIAQVCGPDRIAALTFLAHHMELDVGHTVFNHRQMCDLLAEHPELAPSLAEAGSGALDAYGRFIGDCLTLAS